jgi:hypothetical protein
MTWGCSARPVSARAQSGGVTLEKLAGSSKEESTEPTQDVLQAGMVSLIRGIHGAMKLCSRSAGSFARWKARHAVLYPSASAESLVSFADRFPTARFGCRLRLGPYRADTHQPFDSEMRPEASVSDVEL